MFSLFFSLSIEEKKPDNHTGTDNDNGTNTAADSGTGTNTSFSIGIDTFPGTDSGADFSWY